MARCDVGHVRELGEWCGKDAVIHYDELNLCAEHADPNVLALVRAAEALIKDADDGGACELCGLPYNAHHERCTVVPLARAVAAMAPRAETE